METMNNEMYTALLNSYRKNLQDSLAYGPNDIRGITAIENMRMILHQVHPNDPNIVTIEKEVIVGQLSQYMAPNAPLIKP